MTSRIREIANPLSVVAAAMIVVVVVVAIFAIVVVLFASDAPPPSITVTLITGVRIPCWTLTVDAAPGADPRVLCAYKTKDGAAGYLFHGWPLAQVRTIEARAR